MLFRNDKEEPGLQPTPDMSTPTNAKTTCECDTSDATQAKAKYNRDMSSNQTTTQARRIPRHTRGVVFSGSVNWPTGPVVSLPGKRRLLAASSPADALGLTRLCGCKALRLSHEKPGPNFFGKIYSPRCAQGRKAWTWLSNTLCAYSRLFCSWPIDPHGLMVTDGDCEMYEASCADEQLH